MTRQQKRARIEQIVDRCGADILDSEEYRQTDKYIQHGSTTTREHMISAACVSVKIARIFKAKCDQQSLVRGALLHDYFLYDWHSPKNTHPEKHPTRHSSYALKNASEDFAINPLEAEIIREHMFPCTLKIPRHKESWILITADKICSVKETFSKPFYADLVQELKHE
ncbi:HD domain-containing protein [Candidatus Saccharibacteria bacterium]|nr:HD domain-containing protein [Candidatus Saccharibacteria bacterium]